MYWHTGQTANSFKDRYNSHRSDFRHEKFRTSTRLSELVWSLKDEDKEYDISWSVLAKAKPYSPVTRRCKLCTAEKWWIMERPGTASINRKSELFSACRHMDSQLLTPQRKSKKVGQGWKQVKLWGSVQLSEHGQFMGCFLKPSISFCNPLLMWWSDFLSFVM